jgi:prepilin-type N-terminal cleavage/methylation domain-containing protein
MHALRSRRAFTLVELLVVLAIIGILIALLLPAVQASREQGRVTVCRNNLHQLALATHNFQDTRGTLPIYWGAEAKLYGSWFVHLLPYMEEGNTLGRILEKGNGAMGRYTVKPAISNGPYKPGTQVCVPPTRTCLKWSTPPANGPNTPSVGHGFTLPGSATCLQWTPQTCTVQGGYGIPPTPAVTAWMGIDAVDVNFPGLLCPSEPYRKETKANPLNRGGPYGVTNYLANYNVFTKAEKTGAPWHGPERLDNIKDGASHTIMFGEAYSHCDKIYRLALWGDNRWRKLPTDPSTAPPAYPAQNFGINWYSDANTYFFQHRPRKNRCNNWRLQGLHPGGLAVALADGSVKMIAPNMPRQEKTNPERDYLGSGDPVPVNIEAGKSANMPLGIWDRLLLPRDGEAVEDI